MAAAVVSAADTPPADNSVPAAVHSQAASVAELPGSQAAADSHPAFLAAGVALVVLPGQTGVRNQAAAHNRPVSLAAGAASVALPD